jgi:hypothetical protein
MRKCLLATIFLVAPLACVRADQNDGEGILLDVTPDAIKIQQGGATVLTLALSDDLLANTIPNNLQAYLIYTAKITELRKGDKVQFGWRDENGRRVCFGVKLWRPGVVGVVTAVGSDTLTIRSDEGITTTYKVQKKAADGREPDDKLIYSSALYPSRLSEATPGRRIEARVHRVNGEPTIVAIDVKKETEKDPEKP